MINNDCICALATASGVGALGVIRISGENSIKITNNIFHGKNLENVDSHSIHYGYIKDNEEIIDEVMISIFHAPKTFTTENSAEISFHGSPHIARRILQVLTKNGARIAKPGEFTLRAFINGRIDLSQAESVADLISSENESSRKIALNQLRGGISSEISLLRDSLLNFASLVELELDFSEEDVEFADRSSLLKLITKIEEKLKSLIDGFKYGNAIKNGIPVAIIGKPNAGKSTLLNSLLKEERAIVSEIEGTTRDTIEEILNIEGNSFRLIDTAGLRKTNDKIEALGIEKTREKAQQADIIIYLIDIASNDISEDLELVKNLLNNKTKLIICLTKIDEYNSDNTYIIEKNINDNFSNDFHLIKISALKNINIHELKNELCNYINFLNFDKDNTLITNERHFEALKKTEQSLQNVKNSIFRNITTELLAYELRQSIEYLGEITGEVSNDEILGNIFSKFCIGK